MRRYFMIAVGLLVAGLSPVMSALATPESQPMNAQVIYVFRHAEKADTPDNPALNESGRQRAQQLARALQHAQVQVILSTRYARTQQTAAPLAQYLGLHVETYAAGDADAVVKRAQELGQTTLIVGHSNTVPSIVRAGGGEAPDLTEQDYGDLFQLVITKEGVLTNRFYVGTE